MGVTVINESGPYYTPTGAYIPSGGECFYVGASQPVGEIGEKITNDRFFTTINAAFAACQSGRGDTIFVLPGYTESITGADAWSGLGTKTDVSVVGMGRGTNRPAITWTAALSSVLMDAANFRIANMQLFLAGPQAAGTAVTVAGPIVISAAGCAITDCDIYWGFDADQIVTIGITTTAAADNCKFNRNYCFAETAAVPTTTFLRITGCDQMEIDSTMIIGPGSTTSIGPVQQLTTGSKGMKVINSVFQNTLASSTHSFTAIAGCTGIVALCHLGVLAAGNGITTGSGLQVTGTWVAVAGAQSALATG